MLNNGKALAKFIGILAVFLVIVIGLAVAYTDGKKTVKAYKANRYGGAMKQVLHDIDKK